MSSQTWYDLANGFNVVHMVSRREDNAVDTYVVHMRQANLLQISFVKQSTIWICISTFQSRMTKVFLDEHSRCKRKRIHPPIRIPEILLLHHLAGNIWPFTLVIANVMHLPVLRERRGQRRGREITDWLCSEFLKFLSLICRGDSGIGEAVLGGGSTADTYQRGFSFNKLLSAVYFAWLTRVWYSCSFWWP
jgi:hypothetical protein